MLRVSRMDPGAFRLELGLQGLPAVGSGLSVRLAPGLFWQLGIPRLGFAIGFRVGSKPVPIVHLPGVSCMGLLDQFKLGLGIGLGNRKGVEL